MQLSTALLLVLGAGLTQLADGPRWSRRLCAGIVGLMLFLAIAAVWAPSR